MVTSIASSRDFHPFQSHHDPFLEADGVAAINIVLYGQFLLTAIFLGFSGVWLLSSVTITERRTGVQLKRVVRISLIVILGCSPDDTGRCAVVRAGLVGIFAGGGTPVYPPTARPRLRTFSR